MKVFKIAINTIAIQHYTTQPPYLFTGSHHAGDIPK
jgi:hypothetical protein